jgi:hypothetical protein
VGDGRAVRGALGFVSGRALGSDPACPSGLDYQFRFCLEGTARKKSAILGIVGSGAGAWIGYQLDEEESRNEYHYRFRRPEALVPVLIEENLQSK